MRESRPDGFEGSPTTFGGSSLGGGGIGGVLLIEEHDFTFLWREMISGSLSFLKRVKRSL